MSKKETKLTEKQLAFIDYYLETLNGREAYKRAYGTKKDSTADTNSSRMLSNAKVKQVIDERLAEIKSKRNKSKLNKATGKFEADFKKRSWVDFRKLKEIFEPFEKNPKLYTIERIQYRPMEGETSSFMNGNALGVFQGLYAYLQPIQYLEPTAGEWKKELKVSSLKDTSIKLAEEIYQVNLKDFVKKGKVDDIAEALLLSFYGFKKYYDKNGG